MIQKSRSGKSQRAVMIKGSKYAAQKLTKKNAPKGPLG